MRFRLGCLFAYTRASVLSVLLRSTDTELHHVVEADEQNRLQ